MLGTVHPERGGYALLLRAHVTGRQPAAVDEFVSEDGLTLAVRTFSGDPRAKRGGDVDPATT